MTTEKDIVERLSVHSLYTYMPHECREAMDEAADEITRLREALADIAEDRMPMYRPDGSRWWADGGEGFMEWAKQHAATAIASGQYRQDAE